MKILVALDQSDYAGKVLDKAVEMARKDNAELTLFTVAEQFHDAVYVAEGAVDADERLRAKATEYIEEQQTKAAAMGVKAVAVSEAGSSPADSIVSFAEENKPDLIIMGSRGRTGLARFLLGSVASKVVSHAPCSVLVVR